MKNIVIALSFIFVAACSDGTTAEIPENQKTSGFGTYSVGVRVGRLVKLSQKGLVSKSVEAIIQVGNAGNQFKHMSMNEKMFNCALDVLKSAKKVKFSYVESIIRNPLTSDTSYKITKITPIQDL